MFKRLSLLIIYIMFASVLLAFATDLMAVTMYYDDVRTQTYLGGFHVAGMSADPTELAKGNTNIDDLYKDKDIKESFSEFSNASFGGMTSSPVVTKDMGNTSHMQFKINKMFIRDIVTSCEILNIGGTKGIDITVEYRIDPRINMLFGEGYMEGIPYYRLPIKRRFRLMGQ